MSRKSVLALAFLLLFSSLAVVPVGVSASDHNGTEGPTQCRTPVENIDTVDTVDSADFQVEFTPRSNGTVVASYSRVSNSSESTLRVSVPSWYHTQSTRGFEVIDPIGSGERLAWDGEGTEPSVVYQARILERLHRGNPPKGSEPYHDESSTSTTSLIPEHYGGTFLVEFPDGGHIGNTIMHVGPVDRVETIDRGCHTIDIVVPQTVDDENVGWVKSLLDDSATDFDVGGEYHSTTLFVHSGQVGGYANWGDGVYGDSVERFLARGHAPPLHEYIHTRQQQRLSYDMEWYREASATYHTARFLYDNGHISTAEYDYTLSQYTVTNSSGDLTDPGTWSNSRFNYDSGAIYLSNLDRDLREATDGESTMQDVFADLNGPGRIDTERFAQTLQRHGLNRTQEDVEANLSNPAALTPAYQQDEPELFPVLTFAIQRATGAPFAVANGAVIGFYGFLTGGVLARLYELIGWTRQKVDGEKVGSESE